MYKTSLGRIFKKKSRLISSTMNVSKHAIIPGQVRRKKRVAAVCCFDQQALHEGTESVREQGRSNVSFMNHESALEWALHTASPLKKSDPEVILLYYTYY
jgi:hypothetical protein